MKQRDIFLGGETNAWLGMKETIRLFKARYLICQRQ